MRVGGRRGERLARRRLGWRMPRLRPRQRSTDSESGRFEKGALEMHYVAARITKGGAQLGLDALKKTDG